MICRFNYWLIASHSKGCEVFVLKKVYILLNKKNKMNTKEKELKSFMSLARNVEQWNELREEAKLLFPIEEIRKLESSGFITQVLGEDNNKKKGSNFVRFCKK